MTLVAREAVFAGTSADCLRVQSGAMRQRMHCGAYGGVWVGEWLRKGILSGNVEH